MFTSEDWQAIADVAARTMANGILQIGESNGNPYCHNLRGVAN
jgi:hypothetical protein